MGGSGNDDYPRACGRRETALQGTNSYGLLPAQGIGAGGREERAEGTARRLAPLGQTAETHGIRLGGSGERGLIGREPVPRDLLVDGEVRLPTRPQRDRNRSRRCLGVHRDGVGGQAQRAEPFEYLLPQRVLTDAGHQPRVGTKGASVV